jgi:signal peptidase I
MDTLRDILEIVLLALMLAIVIRVFVVETFLVDGPSMEPTMYTNERLLVLKLAYRVAEPKRGDIVVFRYPFDTSRDFIKRVIAQGGDTIEIRLGRVYVNGQLRDEPYVQNPGLYQMSATKIPEGFLFVMGDNRVNSEDSRMFGPIKADLVKGKAIVRIWPPSKMGVMK